MLYIFIARNKLIFLLKTSHYIAQSDLDLMAILLFLSTKCGVKTCMQAKLSCTQNKNGKDPNVCFFSFSKDFVHVSVLRLCVTCVDVCSIHEIQKRMLDFLELELQVCESPDAGARNHI